MCRNKRIDVMTGIATFEERPFTAQEVANQEAESVRLTAEASKASARATALADVPASANSIPALRDEINKLKAIIRGE